MVKVLCYWSDSPRIDSRWCHWIFQWHISFLGLTQPLVKISTRNIPGGEGGRCVRLTTSPPLRAECHGIWEPKLPGTLWATPGLLWETFTFTSTSSMWQTQNVAPPPSMMYDNETRSWCATISHFHTLHNFSGVRIWESPFKYELKTCSRPIHLLLLHQALQF